MKRFAIFSFEILLLFCVFIAPNLSEAACSCTGSGQIGIEIVATSCPADPPSDSHTYYYVWKNIECKGNSIVKTGDFGGEYYTPKRTEQIWTGYNHKILRNSSGTHMFAAIPSFTGTVEGESFSSSIKTSDKMDKYCVYFPADLPDSDVDGFINCLDCNDSDSSLNIECPTDPLCKNCARICIDPSIE
jgi:hypothetical protein